MRLKHISIYVDIDINFFLLGKYRKGGNIVRVWRLLPRIFSRLRQNGKTVKRSRPTTSGFIE